jgi:hypothetical protein
MWSSKHGVVVTLAALAGSLLSIPSFADSQVRIVRLSDVKGEVQIDRNTGSGFEKASVNLPVTQGVKLRSGRDGFAVVEFEDGSTLRLTPETAVGFSELGLRDSGAKASRVAIPRGLVYVSYAGTKNDEFAIDFGSQALKLDRAAHLRLETNPAHAEVAVFKGEARVDGPAGVVELDKKQSATFDLAGHEPYTLAKRVEEGPFDNWDKEQEDYNQRYSKNSVSTGLPYSYGATDLNYYGSFFSVPGYGMMWQPYFTGAGWDPFMNGVWASYPGMGFGWASAYPWGWLPYHYGSWMFLPTYGWAWQPGGSWAGLNNIPRSTIMPRGFVAPQPPSSMARSLVPVNRGGLVSPVRGSADKLVISNGSAGMGIPRGSINNLGKMSQQAERRGFASARVQPQMANPAMMRGMTARTPTGMSRAAAPPMQTSGRNTPATRGSSAPPVYSAPRSAPTFTPMPSGNSGGGARRGK